MASIRELKKDINYLTDEIVQHSLLIDLLYKGNENEIKEVVATALSQREELMDRVRVKKQTKAEYKKIRKDLIENTDKSFEKLAKLTEE